MLARFFVFTAIAVAISALSCALYLEIRLQSWNEADSRMSQLVATNGECSKSKGYGVPVWNCPTEEMEELKEDLRDMGYELSNAEQTRNLSYAFVIVGPLIIIFIGRVVIGTVIPIIATALYYGKRGAQRASGFSASTSRKAVTEASRLTDAARGRTKECPSCAEMIKPQAKVCRHCGRDV